MSRVRRNHVTLTTFFVLAVFGCGPKDEQAATRDELAVLSQRLELQQKEIAALKVLAGSQADVATRHADSLQIANGRIIRIESVLGARLLDTPLAVAPSAVHSGSMAARPPSAPPEKMILVSVSARPTESNDSWTRFAWQVQVHNGTGATGKASVDVEFQDSAGYEIDSSPIFQQMQTGETKNFTGSALIKAALVKNVVKVTAKLENGNSITTFVSASNINSASVAPAVSKGPGRCSGCDHNPRRIDDSGGGSIQVYLDRTNKMFHAPGCSWVGPGMEVVSQSWALLQKDTPHRCDRGE